MKKVLATILLLAASAFACTGIFPTNIQGIRWQYCPENSAVAIGNFGPRTVTVDFNVIYIDGTFNSYEEVITPRAFTTEEADGPVSNVVVTNIAVY